MAPIYQPYRSAVAAADTLATMPKTAGANATGYQDVHVQVIPSGGANPTVLVAWWSEAAGRFVPEHTPLEKAGTGADTPYEFTIQPKGRIFVVAVKTIAAGAVAIHLSAFGLDNLV